MVSTSRSDRRICTRDKRAQQVCSGCTRTSEEIVLGVSLMVPDVSTVSLFVESGTIRDVLIVHSRSMSHVLNEIVQLLPKELERSFKEV